MLISSPYVQHPIDGETKPTICPVGIVVSHSVVPFYVEGKSSIALDLVVEFTSQYLLRRLLPKAPEYQGIEGRAISLEVFERGPRDAMIVDIHQGIAREVPPCGPELSEDRAQRGSP
jgi:hypothetical protein